MASISLYPLGPTNVSLPNEDEYTLKIGDSTKLKTGDPVTIIGYPNHNKGNTPYIQNCAITSQKISCKLRLLL